MKKIRDEHKGIIFIALIILVIAVVSVIFGVSLKSPISNPSKKVSLSFLREISTKATPKSIPIF